MTPPRKDIKFPSEDQSKDLNLWQLLDVMARINKEPRTFNKGIRQNWGNDRAFNLAMWQLGNARQNTDRLTNKTNPYQFFQLDHSQHGNEPDWLHVFDPDRYFTPHPESAWGGKDKAFFLFPKQASLIASALPATSREARAMDSRPDLGVYSGPLSSENVFHWQRQQPKANKWGLNNHGAVWALSNYGGGFTGQPRRNVITEDNASDLDTVIPDIHKSPHYDEPYSPENLRRVIDQQNEDLRWMYLPQAYRHLLGARRGILNSSTGKKVLPDTREQETVTFKNDKGQPVSVTRPVDSMIRNPAPAPPVNSDWDFSATSGMFVNNRTHDLVRDAIYNGKSFTPDPRGGIMSPQPGDSELVRQRKMEQNVAVHRNRQQARKESVGWMPPLENLTDVRPQVPISSIGNMPLSDIELAQIDPRLTLPGFTDAHIYPYGKPVQQKSTTQQLTPDSVMRDITHGAQMSGHNALHHGAGRDENARAGALWELMQMEENLRRLGEMPSDLEINANSIAEGKGPAKSTEEWWHDQTVGRKPPQPKSKWMKLFEPKNKKILGAGIGGLTASGLDRNAKRGSN